MRKLPWLFNLLWWVGTANAEPSATRIGVILPLSGEAHQAGEQVRSGIEKAAVPGIQLVFEDDACSAKNGLSIYRRLSDQEQLKYFLGPCCSSPMKVVAPLLSKQDQVGMAVCGLSESVLDSAHGHLFSPHYSIESEDAFISAKMTEMGIKKVALVFLDNDFSRAHENGFRKAFHGEVTSFPFVDYSVGSIKTIIVQLKSKAVDAVYVPLVEPLLLGFMKEMKNLGLGEIKIFSIYGAQMNDVIAANGVAADGLLYSHPAIPMGEDADVYFPRMGAEILGKAVASCQGKYSCVVPELKKGNLFDEHGALRHEIELRTIRNGKFERK